MSRLVVEAAAGPVHTDFSAFGDARPWIAT
jgi:hypothetical protein